ncbi:Ovate protein family, C-terminal [Cynara cardunculus var. scolymus]|uniref:Transcription repressor n=1 Tax=Cynara cardunculus var. scolymus TaxID=59895 RepID=A0A118K5C9_CYNCS|nr:Ovate protein family, C-terminal [Cynara cardunculus var. scolymus]
MVKFKLRIFRSFRTKDTSTPPEKPASPRQRHKLTEVDLTCTTSPPPSEQPPHRSSFKTHLLCSVFRCGSSSGNHSASEDLQWHVVESPRRKIYNSSAIAGVFYDDGERFHTPIQPSIRKKNRRVRKVKKNKPTPVTTSSPDSDQFTTKYTIDEDEQKPGIISSSSRSFSTNSPTVPSPHPQPNYKVKKKRVKSRHKGGKGGGVSPEWGSPARLSVFKKLMPCKVEGKVRESFAVVKRSENPYEDFKKSMTEMIVEKQMVEESDLTQLLQCFLSLNSRYHHDIQTEVSPGTK